MKRTLLKNPALPFHVPKEMPLLAGLAWTERDGASHASASGDAFLRWGLFHFYLLSTAHSLLFPLYMWHEEGNAPSSATNRQ